MPRKRVRRAAVVRRAHKPRRKKAKVLRKPASSVLVNHRISGKSSQPQLATESAIMTALPPIDLTALEDNNSDADSVGFVLDEMFPGSPVDTDDEESIVNDYGYCDYVHVPEEADITKELVKRYVESLDEDLYQQLLSKWHAMRHVVSPALPGDFVRHFQNASGCTGSGLVEYQVTCVAEHLNSLTNGYFEGEDPVEFKVRFVTESDPKKQEWLKQFSSAKHIFDDVGKLINGEEVLDVKTPSFVQFHGCCCFGYWFGFSCKDLSGQNSTAEAYKSTCLETESGTSGITFAGNMAFVRESKPLVVFIENVPHLATSPNMRFLLNCLEEAGYSWE